jgi:hypothetical protein
MLRRACVGCAFVAALLAFATTAHAYEFWLRARTVGQAYQLREYRLVGPDLFVGRHRITQLLALRIYDIGDLAAARRRSRLPEGGLRMTWQSYLRIDHDFGDYTSGRIRLPGPVVRDAIDVIPDLAESVAELDLMYGYLQLDGLADDRLHVELGRLLVDDGWGSGAFDGAAVKVELPGPAPLAVGASGGLRVRAATPFGPASYELDGTSNAGCREYVEGPTPGSGSWQLVDRNRTIQNHRLESDYEYCPQRLVRQPTVAVSLSTVRTHGFSAEVGYRRTWSETVGVFGSVDRLDYPDVGFYPSEFGQAPGSGVNEERLHARVHGDIDAGSLALSPYADARYSILHGVVDRADLGVRMRRGEHAIEPVLEYFFPTFDGDSIFNAFSLEPTTDARVRYEYMPSGPLRAHASGWLRAYDDAPGLSRFAGGMDAGVEHAFGGGWRGRVDALWDDGWGGRRIGGAADAALRGAGRMWWRGRVIVLGVAEDETANQVTARRFVTSSAVLSTTYRIAENVGVHAIAETNYDAIHDLQLRVIGVLDLNFAPEP